MKSILVTGGSKGIGKAVCKSFSREKYRVLFTSRSKDNIFSLEKEFKEDGAQDAKGFVLDIASHSDIRALIDFIEKESISLDVLVNNAGIGFFNSVVDIEIEEWDRLIATNLSGVFYLTKAVLPLMIRQKSGSIINIGSLASRNTFAGGALYCASKFALLGFTECLMLDVRKHGIKVSIIMPGSVNTSFNNSPVKDDGDDYKLSDNDVARAVLDVVSSRFGSLVSKVEMRPTIPK